MKAFQQGQEHFIHLQIGERKLANSEKSKSTELRSSRQEATKYEKPVVRKGPRLGAIAAEPVGSNPI